MKALACLFLIITGSLLAASPSTGAAASITYLGKPAAAQVLNTYSPIGGFHRISGAAPVKGATLLFIGTQYDGYSALERWPLVKALDQFGTLTQVGKSTPATPQALPTFDLSQARFTSRYLRFVHVDLLNRNGKLYQKMSGAERALYDRFARAAHIPGLKYDPDNIISTLAASSPMNTSGRGLPLIVAGNYEQTRSRVMLAADFLAPSPVPTATPGGVHQFPPPQPPLTFDQVHAALVAGKDPPGTPDLVEAVDTEANIIIAMICRADGERPVAVCGRPVIKFILKGVK